MAEKIAAIVTTGEPERLAELIDLCQAAAAAGSDVCLFFRDESIPVICRPDVQRRLGLFGIGVDGSEGSRAKETWLQDVATRFAELAQREHVGLYACSSSLYVWGVTATDLIPAVSGARGLVAFLADDLDGASRVLSY